MNGRRSLWVIPALAFMLAACSSGAAEPTASKSTPTGPTVSISSPTKGSSVGGNIVSLNVAATGIKIVKADGDASGKTGHYHVFIDRDPVAAGETIPKEAGIVHSAASPIEITGLSVGLHRFAVVLGDGTHRRIGSAKAETTVTVNGPSVDASAPATIPAGAPLVIRMKVVGVTLVKADGSSSNTTGHL